MIYRHYRTGFEGNERYDQMKLIKDAGPTMLTIWALLLLTALVSLGLARWSLAFVSVATLGLGR